MLISELPDHLEKAPVYSTESETVTDRTRYFGIKRSGPSASGATDSIPCVLRPERFDTPDELFVTISDVIEGCLDRTVYETHRGNLLGVSDAMDG